MAAIKNISSIAKGMGSILGIPLALTLLAVWRWKPAVFLLAFLLLAGTANLIYGLLKQNKLSNKTYRFAVLLALAGIALLVWMNVAVGGILGDDPANMMYFGVLLVGCTGAIISNLQPEGMSWTLFATAFAIAIVPAIALAIGTPAFSNGVAAVFGLHLVFALLFAGSAFLFKKAERRVS